MKIKDIAQITGLSKGTVSKVINNYPGISEKVKEKVKKAVEENGFVPNNFARNLSKKQTGIIGLFLFTEEGFQQSPFFENFVGIIIDEAEKKGMSVLVSLLNSKLKKKKVMEFYKSKLIDGGIFLGMDSDEEEIKKLEKNSCNAVLINQIAENKNIACVNTGGYTGGRMATKYLLDSGCKSILHVTGSLERMTFKERLKGFQDLAEESEVQYSIFQKTYVGSNIEHDFKSFLEKMPQFPDGIFCGNDETAISVLEVLKSLALEPGKSIKVIGFDDIEASKYIEPKLTTIKPDLKKAAEKSIEMLLERVNSQDEKAANYYEIETKLIVRET